MCRIGCANGLTGYDYDDDDEGQREGGEKNKHEGVSNQDCLQCRHVLKFTVSQLEIYETQKYIAWKPDKNYLSVKQDVQQFESRQECVNTRPATASSITKCKYTLIWHGLCTITKAKRA